MTSESGLPALSSPFGTFIVGKTLSSLAIWIYTVVIVMLAFEVSGSGLGVGVVSAAMFTPQLIVAPVGGRLADGGHAVVAVMAGRVLMTVGCGVVAVAAHGGGPGPAFLTLTVASLFMGLGLAISGPAMESLLTVVADRPRLAGAVSLNSMPMVAGRVAGPLLGAWIVVWHSATVAMAAAAVLCLAHAVMMRSLLPARNGRGRGSEPRIPVSVLVEYLRTDGASSRALMGMFAVGFSTDIAATMTPLVVDDRSQDGDAVGALVSAYGVGTAVGLAAFTWLVRRSSLVVLSRAGLGLVAACTFSLMLWPVYALDVVSYAASGIGMMLAYLCFTAHIQRQAPRLLRGRVIALWLVLFVGARPLAALVNGTLVDLAGIEVALGTIGLVVAVAAIACCSGDLSDHVRRETPHMAGEAMTFRLTEANVASYLTDRGRVAVLDPIVVTVCSGGVSGATYLVEAGDSRVVVKQALPELRTAASWLSDPRRALVEARALEVFGDLVGPYAPELIDADPEHCVVTMSAAPAGSRPWKELLMNGEIQPRTAAELGHVLGRWHQLPGETYRAAFADLTWFDELRVTPFYRAVAAARPEVSGRVEDLIDEMGRSRQALTHGDFSPKNVLVHPGGHVWVIDYEVCHWGDPAFDLGFMLHHLVMKAIHMPAHSARLRECAQSFIGAYGRSAGAPHPDLERVFAHVGCLMASRVVGTSPAGYLQPQAAQRVLDLGLDLLVTRPSELDDFWPIGVLGDG